jgi:Mrp family chromosome partitioning ATPase
MSKNFELLRRAGQDEVVFGPLVNGSRSDNGSRARSDAKLSLEEAGPAGKVDTPRRALNFTRLAQEETVRLVQRVFLLPNSHAPRAVVFSSVQNKGSSEICFRTGEVLATQGLGSVCLVDADVNAPSLHQLLGVARTPGLTDATLKLSPIKNFAIRIAEGNLWVLPSGSLNAQGQGMFASDRWRSRMEELRREFDYVLIDAPPVNSYAEAILLGQLADGIILVLEANSTRRETARVAKETLEAAKVKVLGAILNNRTFPIPEVLYHKLGKYNCI